MLDGRDCATNEVNEVVTERSSEQIAESQEQTRSLGAERSYTQRGGGVTEFRTHLIKALHEKGVRFQRRRDT